jgi:NAD(P)-dependent dehydrogenase (short-subunit alcohol dehydrogenase family)
VQAKVQIYKIHSRIITNHLGTPGIGHSVARQLQSRGCSILGTCSSSQSLSLIDAIEEQREQGNDHDVHSSVSTQPQVHGIIADILSPTCAIDIADTLETHFNGRLDILVLNAAITGSVRIGDRSNDEKANEIQPYLVGNIQTSVLIVNELVKRKMFRENSRIVCISSIRSKQSTPTS